MIHLCDASFFFLTPTVDGGFSRKSCFWDFVRHLDRLDAVLMTRVNNSNISGLSSVIERKAKANVYPQIGHFFTNIPQQKGLPSPDGDKDKDPLLVDLMEEGHNLFTNLKTLNLKAQHCYRDTEPLNLYHKVGHGTLDMYVISPSKDSKEVREFIQKWNSSDPKLFATKDAKEFIFPLQNMVSICALLIWTPANPEDNVTRILFPGSTPEAKIFEGLDKIKSLEFLKHPVCTVKSITASISSTTLSTKKTFKSGLAEKITEPSIPSKPLKPLEKDNKALDEKILDNKANEESTLAEEKKKMDSRPKPIKKKDEPKKIEKIKRETAKDSDVESQEDKKAEEIIESPVEPKKDLKLKPKEKIVARSRIDTKPPKVLKATPKKDDNKEQQQPSRSSPTTPKKTATAVSATNGSAVKSKVVTRSVRASPKGTPAKSTKEANNRKVLEVAKAAVQKKEIVKKEAAAKVERKPISRRSRIDTVDVRKTQASPSKKVLKTEKDAVIRKSRIDKNGTTDSSLVSTPSADEAAKRVASDIEDPDKQQELAELKEEQEAVREIEAVFKKEKSVVKELIADHREVQDSATEPDEEEEYLIIEKEEPYTEDSVNDASSATRGEDEHQKIQRDSEESEKRRKGSLEVTEEEDEQDVDQEKGEIEIDEQKVEVSLVPMLKLSIFIKPFMMTSLWKFILDD